VGDGLLFDIFGANNAGFKSVWFNHSNQFLPTTREEQQYSEQANTCIAALTDLLALNFNQI